MRSAIVTAFFAAALVRAASPALTLPEKAAIGRNLEAFTTVKLTVPAPTDLDVTITSSDPHRLLFSTMPDNAGQPSITLKVRGHYLETPDFYIQAIGQPGPVAYSAMAAGYETAKGTVTIVPSAILMSGPSRSATFHTTPRLSARI